MFHSSTVVVVQSVSYLRLFTTPWTVAHQAFLSFTTSQILLKLMSIDLVMPSNHLIPLLPPSLLALNLSQYQGLSQWVSSSHQVAEVLESQPHHQSFQWIGETSFRIDRLDFLAVQGILKSFLQHHSLKASIFWCSAFFMVQLSHPYTSTGKTTALTIWYGPLSAKWYLWFLMPLLSSIQD